LCLAVEEVGLRACIDDVFGQSATVTETSFNDTAPHCCHLNLQFTRHRFNILCCKYLQSGRSILPDVHCVLLTAVVMNTFSITR